MVNKNHQRDRYVFSETFTRKKNSELGQRQFFTFLNCSSGAIDFRFFQIRTPTHALVTLDFQTNTYGHSYGLWTANTSVRIHVQIF